MRKQERSAISQAKVAVRSTIMSRTKVSTCNACDDSFSSTSNQLSNTQQCQSIVFDCDCATINLGCLNQYQDPDTEIELALGDATSIADCVSTNCVGANGQPIPIQEADIIVQNIPDTDAPPTRNGPISSRIRIFTAIDACGQSATLVRTVTFQETRTINGVNPGPVATCSADRTVPCGTQIRFDSPFFADACGRPCNITVTPRLDQLNFDTNLGDTRTDNQDGTFSYTRTWTASDACANESICTQVIIEDCSTGLIGPAGCTLGYWRSAAGRAFFDSVNDRLVQAMPSNRRFTLDTLITNIFDRELGDLTVNDIFNQTEGQCLRLIQQSLVALLNVTASVAFPGNFPRTYRFPTGSSDFESLRQLIVAEIDRIALINDVNQQETQCVILADILADANATICASSITGCDAAFWTSAEGLALINSLQTPLALRLPIDERFFSQTLITDLFNLNDPTGVYANITVQDVLENGPAVQGRCFDFARAIILLFLNIAAHPEYDYIYIPTYGNYQEYIRQTFVNAAITLQQSIDDPNGNLFCDLRATPYEAYNTRFCQIINNQNPNDQAKQLRTLQRLLANTKTLLALPARRAGRKVLGCRR
jgi:hypothetical protein